MDDDPPYVPPQRPPPPTREPSKLRQLRDNLVAALDVQVKDAEKLDAVARAQVLKEVAVAVAALESAQTAWNLARSQMERRS